MLCIKDNVNLITLSRSLVDGLCNKGEHFFRPLRKKTIRKFNMSAERNVIESYFFTFKVYEFSVVPSRNCVAVKLYNEKL